MVEENLKEKITEYLADYDPDNSLGYDNIYKITKELDNIVNDISLYELILPSLTELGDEIYDKSINEYAVVKDYIPFVFTMNIFNVYYGEDLIDTYAPTHLRDSDFYFLKYNPQIKNDNYMFIKLLKYYVIYDLDDWADADDYLTREAYINHFLKNFKRIDSEGNLNPVKLDLNDPELKKVLSKLSSE